MWVLIVFNTETLKIRVFGAWHHEDQANQAAIDYVKRNLRSTDPITVTVTKIDEE